MSRIKRSRTTALDRGTLGLVACPFDEGPLFVEARTADGSEGQSTVVCRQCQQKFPAPNDIITFVADERLDSETAHERTLRDEKAKQGDRTSSAETADLLRDPQEAMEMIPTLGALALNGVETLLELGCGTGRYTRIAKDRCRRIVGVDISYQSLLSLAAHLEGAMNVLLVHADVDTLKVATRQFDVVFSTLVSNLPTPTRRHRLFELAASALTPDGRFVFSVHHHGPRQKLAGAVKSGRYTRGGIYRYAFTQQELVEEVAFSFDSVSVRPIRAVLPLSGALGLPVVPLSNLLGRIPLLNRIGDLLLCVARHPRGR